MKNPIYSCVHTAAMPHQESTGSDLLDSLRRQALQPNATTLLKDKPVVDAGSNAREWLRPKQVQVVKCVSSAAGEKAPKRVKRLRTKVAVTPRSSAVKRLSFVLQEDRARSLPVGVKHLSKVAGSAEHAEA